MAYGTLCKSIKASDLRLTYSDIIQFRRSSFNDAFRRYRDIVRTFEVGRTPACVKTYNSQDTMSAT
jgi:hypothetical protein